MDSEDQTDANFDSPDEGENNSIAEFREIAITKYRDIWHNFYLWEADHCQQMISHLNSPFNLQSPPLGILIERVSMALDLTRSFNIVSDTVFPPYPRYEICTPANKSIVCDDEDDSLLQFVPYADDVSFNICEHIANFYMFAWQAEDGCKDPDKEVIELDAAQDFRNQGYSFSKINALRILRQDRISNESGLIWDNSQRDLLLWPGSQLFNHGPTVLQPDLLLDTNVFNRVNQMVMTFCPNLTCIEPRCSYHTSPYSAFDGSRPSRTIKNVNETNICGENCYLLYDVNELIAKPVFWDESDIDVLSSILRILPDSLPCDLAVICHKHCWEVFIHRQNDTSVDLHDDEDLNESSRAVQKRRAVFTDNQILLFTPSEPCSHKGSCDQGADCSCVKGGLHCQRGCRCDQKCSRRWRGCSCKSHSKSCTDGKVCQCQRSERECNPELCIRCCASQEKPCKNMAIHQGLYPIIEIKQALYGLGAFATQPYKKGDFVGYYVGLSCDKDQRDSLHTILKFTKHNYIFSLNSSKVIDALEIGNELRYLNHASSPNNNCEAKNCLLDGKHHIGLFTTKRIAEGDEMLLDYGENYWVDSD